MNLISEELQKFLYNCTMCSEEAAGDPRNRRWGEKCGELCDTDTVIQERGDRLLSGGSELGEQRDGQ